MSKDDLLRFDLQLFAGPNDLAPLDVDPATGSGANEPSLDESLAALDRADDFDATLRYETEQARARDLDSFAPRGGEPDDEEPLPSEDSQPRKNRAQRRQEERERAAADRAAQTQDGANAQAQAEANAAGQPAQLAAAAQPAAQPAQAAAPAQPAAPNDDEPIALNAQVSWPRKHVVAALVERERMLGDLRKFQDALGVDADGAVANWKPLVDRIRQEPAMGVFLQDMADSYDPGRAEYLARCSANYDAHVASRGGSQPAQAARPAQVPKEVAELRAEIERLKQSESMRSRAAAEAAIQQERSVLEARYPALKDQKVLRFVATHAMAMNQQDPSYTLTRAADELADYLTRFASAPAGATAGAPALAAVPAVNGGNGASPSGTRRAAPREPSKFQSTDEALEHWLVNESARYS